MHVLFVAAGGAAGALVRWGLGALLNPFFSALPMGTLVDNLLGGYIMRLLLKPQFRANSALFLRSEFLRKSPAFSHVCQFTQDLTTKENHQNWPPKRVMQ